VGLITTKEPASQASTVD